MKIGMMVRQFMARAICKIQMIRKKRLDEFEMEFCLTKQAYCKIYEEDGSLWDDFHVRQMALFHKMYKAADGRVKIMGDLQCLFWTYFKSKKAFFTSFALDEFSREEQRFLKDEISCLKKW